jgi:hypothetical protein
MAGYVAADLNTSFGDRTDCHPHLCPAQGRDSSLYVDCARAKGDSQSTTCPFFLAADVLEKGQWVRSSAFAITHGERHGISGYYPRIRVICLRKESKDTPVGAI